MNLMKKETITLLINGKKQRARRFWLVTLFLGIGALFLCCAMLMMGNTIYPPEIILRALLGEEIQGASYAVNTIRFPRMLSGLFAGFAFGLAGSVFQTMLRNPLANPNIIGITSGSSAGAVACIVLLHTSSTTVYLVSIAAGLGTTLVMFALAKGRRFSTSKLILIGIGVQAMLNAVVSYILEAGAEQDIATAMRWLSGSLNGVRLSELYLLLAAVLITTPVILVFSRQLAMLELGEEWAAGLGVSPDRVRFILMTGSVLLIATATAATGPIAFVSFLARPIAKRLTGHGTASPLASGLFGAVLVLLSDLVGQFAFELRFPVGVITGILGAPYLLFLLVRMNKSGEL